MKKYLSVLLFLIISSKLAFATDEQAAISTLKSAPKLGFYGLTAEKEVVFLQAQQNYILMLNDHFTHPSSTRFKLPTEFFELKPIPEESSERLLSAWIKGGVNVSQALDSLTNNQPYELDCTIAVTLAQLAGIREVIGNDSRFDQLCNTLRGGKGNPTELTNFYQTKARITKQLQKPTAYGTPGSISYLEQIPFSGRLKRFFQLNAFGITPDDPTKTQENAIDGLIKALCKGHHFSGNLFVLKHQQSHWQGLNVLLTSENEGLFFESGLLNPLLLQDIARRLVIEMDADLTQTEQDLFSANPNLALALNGISYVSGQRNTPSVAETILERTTQQSATIIDFTRINEILEQIDAKRKEIEKRLLAASKEASQ